MRRTLVYWLLLVSALFLIAPSAIAAADYRAAHPVQWRITGAVRIFQWEATTYDQLPSAVTFYEGAGGAFYLARMFDALPEIDGIKREQFFKVPSGQSVLTPRTVAYDSSGTKILKIYVAAHADTVFALGWSE